MTPDKVCPVVLSYSLPTKILLFRHPLAGTQLVKGTIENGETPSVAALRELAEETGIVDAVIGSDLGCWKADHQHQVWSFHLCRAGSELPESWVHQTLDDHGHRFDFFWASLDNLPYADCHPVFQRALVFLCETLRASDHWRDEGPSTIIERLVESSRSPLAALSTHGGPSWKIVNGRQ